MDEFDEICRRCTPVVYRFLLSLCKDASLADELTAETFYHVSAHWHISRQLPRRIVALPDRQKCPHKRAPPPKARRPLRGNARARRAGRHF